MIRFQNVWKSYPKELFSTKCTALQDVSFSLERGKTLGLIGANGAGKSTSIRLVMDFIRPDKGSITLCGSSPFHFGIRQKIGYLPETANFPDNLTVLDLLRFTGATCAISHSMLNERGEHWLRKLDLWDARKRPLRNYSKGMQQRANFAIALINDPELLILDEPMSGLDPMGRSSIIKLIQQLKKSGKTILFCSHILEDVDRLVDDILVLHKGRNLFYGKPDDLAAQENKPSMVEAFVHLAQQIEESNLQN